MHFVVVVMHLALQPTCKLATVRAWDLLPGPVFVPLCKGKDVLHEDAKEGLSYHEDWGSLGLLHAALACFHVRTASGTAACL